MTLLVGFWLSYQIQSLEDLHQVLLVSIDFIQGEGCEELRIINGLRLVEVKGLEQNGDVSLPETDFFVAVELLKDASELLLTQESVSIGIQLDENLPKKLKHFSKVTL